MKPMAAALTGALIAGVGAYAVGTRASQNPFAEQPALVQTMDGHYASVPTSSLTPLATRPVSFVGSAAPVRAVQTAAPRTVYQTVERPAPTRTVVTETAPRRSWKKSALVIGGSAASGAGVGAIIGGKKGALIGTALGGGAASIYEAAKH